MIVKSNKPKIKVPDILVPYIEINNLKNLYRQGWLLRGIPEEKCESVAEHTFGVLSLAWILIKHFPELNKDKVFKLAFSHDLGEHHIGDLTPRDDNTDKEKKEREGIRKLKDAELLELFDEYVEQKTPEAIFVKDVDLLEMAIQAKIYHEKYNMNPSEFYETVANEIKNPKLKKILSEMTER
ncbi:HD domain-containing protein [Candidatus Micrarchaeota archaeon]|nr:HD domain-containing protein [Candidatus Micrarchaeota archaeon]